MALDGETESARLRRDVARLRHDVEFALRRALDPTDVLPMLHRLARTAQVGSDESVFAHRQLAELIAPRHPWRAALYARRVLSLRPVDDRAWAVLAFAQTLLGHYRYAAAAYSRALGCSPKNPWYAHNLGHLLDVALGRPEEALPWLASAYAAAKDHAELATSYAHALARSGDLAEAKRVLGRAMRRGDRAPSREQSALWRWLERGAPPPAGVGPSGDSVDAERVNDAADATGAYGATSKRTNVQNTFFPVLADDAEELDAARAAARDDSRARRRTALTAEQTSTVSASEALEHILMRGLAHLPLDAQQRSRARAMARDVDLTKRTRVAKLDATAAAIAYSVVDLDEVPLTQAEVAACFRVRVASLRARYDELRAPLLAALASTRISARAAVRTSGRTSAKDAATGLEAAAAAATVEAPAAEKPVRRRTAAISSRKVKK